MKSFLLLLPLFLCFQAFSQVFVDPDATGTNDGTSWENAFTDLSVALRESPEHSEVWVAEGTYIPYDGTSRDSSFAPKNGMKIYGGFSGLENDISQRDPELYKTILSGETGMADTAGNINVLVSIDNKPDTIIIDGFVLTKATNNNSNTSTITINDCKLKLRNCDITDNVTSTTGSGAGGIKGENCYAEVVNCKFRDNMGTGQRSLYFTNSKVSVRGSLFSGNTINDFGNYMVYISGDDEVATFTNCTFSNNQKSEFAFYTKYTVFQDCNFYGNTASSSMIYASGDSLIVDNCSFDNNTLTGGGYLVSHFNGKYRNSTFRNNNAAAFYCFNDSTSITNCNFTNNTPSDYTSGLIYTRYLDIIDSEFNNNHSGGSSYTLYVSDTCNVINSKFIDNGVEGVTSLAGALYYGSLYAENSLFKGNMAESGGAIYGGPATIRNSTFDGNKATKAAGAIFSSDSLQLENCLFTNNVLDTATQEEHNGGGAIMAYDGATIINCAFSSNSAESGAVFYTPFSTANLLLANCTFFNNFNTGDSIRGIIHSMGNTRVRNSILWDKHKALAFPDSADVQFSIVKGGMTGTGNLNTDPGLGLLFRLKEGSPAIDAGTPEDATDWAVPAFDINGETRTVNQRLDIGASEYQETSGKDLVTGKIYGEYDKNCTANDSDTLLPEMLVVAEPGPFYATTDSTGTYSFLLPPGDYQVTSVLPEKKLISQECEVNKSTLALSGSNDTVQVNDFFFQLIPEPDMRVQVSQSRKRPCMQGTTQISYWNAGNTEAQDVLISVIYPSELIPQQLPGHTQTDSLYQFQAGDVSPGERRSFIIQDSAACIVPDLLSTSVCVKASVSPYHSEAAGAEWDGSDLTITGSCIDDSVNFEISNTGTGAMEGTTDYTISYNDILVKEGYFMLESNESLKVTAPSMDQVVTLLAEERPGHPQETYSTLTLENCGNIPEDTMMMYSSSRDPGDAAVYTDINCMTLTGAYDPNDKKAEPAGKYSGNYIPASQELEFTINFQNTGNDTAFTVVLKDTLSENLDVSSLRVLSASHTFSWEISGEGIPVLSFTFENILLPDSNRNEPQSHGHVVFSIAPAENIPEGSIIENEAFIFFDYNPPIKTNRTFHTIGDPVYTNYDLGLDIFPQVITGTNPEESSLSTKAFPNPVPGSGQVHIVPGKAGVLKTICLNDISGRTVTEVSTTKSKVTLTAPGQPGIYFYSIHYKDGKNISGKLYVDEF